MTSAPSSLLHTDTHIHTHTQAAMGSKPLSRIMFDKYDKVRAAHRHHSACPCAAPRGTDASFFQDGGGQIDAREFGQLLYDFGVVLSPAQLKAAMSTIDGDGSGSISYDEFIKVCVCVCVSVCRRECLSRRERVCVSAHARVCVWGWVWVGWGASVCACVGGCVCVQLSLCVCNCLCVARRVSVCPKPPLTYALCPCTPVCVCVPAVVAHWGGALRQDQAL
jgi:hypothetical protein